MIILGERSLSRLVGVHPDLVRVVKRAAALALPSEDFTILEGVRSRESMMVNYGKGRTVAQCEAKGVPAKYAKPAEKKVTWLNNPFASRHGVQADGYGHAVDIAPFPIDWTATARFNDVARVMLSAALQEGVHIVWGGAWKSPDLPHFELSQ